jgi:murein L,D-transpeptidase YafK
MHRRIALLIGLALVFMLQPQAAVRPWVLVDTTHQSLSVMVGDEVRRTFAGISLGHGGASEVHLEGDGSTPRGVYHIAWVNRHSRFHLFFGLDYPRIEHAERAYQSSKIDYDTYSLIVRADSQGKTPPQDTALGGYIGIHGLGEKSLAVHRKMNWTDGCVALTDTQIDQLAKWVGIGTRVVIM